MSYNYKYPTIRLRNIYRKFELLKQYLSENEFPTSEEKETPINSAVDVGKTFPNDLESIFRPHTPGNIDVRPHLPPLRLSWLRTKTKCIVRRVPATMVRENCERMGRIQAGVVD